jgi:hypothetical protein
MNLIVLMALALISFAGNGYSKNYSKAQKQARSHCMSWDKKYTSFTKTNYDKIKALGHKFGRTADCPSCFKFDWKGCLEAAHNYCMEHPYTLKVTKALNPVFRDWSQNMKNFKNENRYQECVTILGRSILGSDGN